MISLVGMQQGNSEMGLIPPTLNYRQPDPECPVNVVSELQPARKASVLALNHKLTGQAVALVVASD